MFHRAEKSCVIILNLIHYEWSCDLMSLGQVLHHSDWILQSVFSDSIPMFDHIFKFAASGRATMQNGKQYICI